MVRFLPLQEKSAARRRFRRRRDRREPPERLSPNPLDASLRAPSASRAPVSRRSPTAVDAPRVARHVRPPPPGAPSSALIRAAADAVEATPTRLSADAGEALDTHFSLALACHLGKLTTEFVSRDDGSRLEARTSVEEERMTGKVTMAAATAGHAEGGTTLNAFDNALLAAGIGNINLVKVSSILPPEVPVIDLPKIKPGAIVPTAYAAMTSETPGETVAAAVGYAVPDDPAKNGVIMEFHGVASRAEAERQIHLMLDEAFRVRGELIKEKRVVAVEHTTQRIGCALAAITLLADEDLV